MANKAIMSPYQWSIINLGVVWLLFFIFIQILIYHSLGNEYLAKTASGMG